jgi:hypothetical protein
MCFHWILSEIEQIYHDESGQPINKQRLAGIDK